MDDTRLETYLIQLEALIDKEGWAVQGVLGDDENLPFAYTVGLTPKELPELLVYGLPHQTAGAILNHLAKDMITDPSSIAPDTPLEGYVSGFPVILLVARVNHEANMALNLYGEKVRVWQAVFPDQHGKFPWEQEYSLSLDIPLLGLPPGENLE